MQYTPSDLKPRERYKVLTSFVLPRPIAWVTTIGPTGVVNAAPFSFFNVFCEDPPLCMGPIVFVVVVFGGLGSLTGCFIASILMGLIQTFAVVFDVSLADLLAKFGFTVTSSTPFAEVLNVTLPRVGALLPFLMLVLILVFRPRGLMGTRDT